MIKIITVSMDRTYKFQIKMNEVLLVVGLLIAFSLTVSTVTGQSFNETNSTMTESLSGGFVDCYSSFNSGMILWKKFGETNISATEPELKQFFAHICNFVHDETGNWLDIWKGDNLRTLLTQVDMNKFKTKYYPQGIPQPLIDVSSALVGVAGAVGNASATHAEDDKE